MNVRKMRICTDNLIELAKQEGIIIQKDTSHIYARDVFILIMNSNASSDIKLRGLELYEHYQSALYNKP